LEGPTPARALLDAGFAVMATVTTEAGRIYLFGPLQQALAVLVGGFTAVRLTDFLAQRGADLVLDAMHSLAVRITRVASAVCATLRVPYVHYARALLLPGQCVKARAKRLVDVPKQGCTAPFVHVHPVRLASPPGRRQALRGMRQGVLLL
jgi:precorrin-6x reductase